jgi:16S rRNA (uracil1498-N3)-methyltransferase
VDRSDQPPVASFYAPGALTAGATLTLPEGAAHHARVRRLTEGEVVRLSNGAGMLATGQIERLGRGEFDVTLSAARHVPALPPLHVFVPVADRDRMLWLAEKAAELAVTVWQPVRFERSLSVQPRGEGSAFAERVRARMIAALEQSRGAWLPEVRAELPVPGAALESASLDRFVLDVDGVPLARHSPRPAAALVVGPEGGITAAELRIFLEHGWRAASLGENTLRFETAGITAIALFRAHVPHYQED